MADTGIKDVERGSDVAAPVAATAAPKAEDLAEKGEEGSKASEAKDNGKEEDSKPAEKRKRHYRVDTDLLRAFRYFDKTGTTLPHQFITSASPYA